LVWSPVAATAVSEIAALDFSTLADVGAGALSLQADSTINKVLAIQVIVFMYEILSIPNSGRHKIQTTI
jgi:hypothetical protein